MSLRNSENTFRNTCPSFNYLLSASSTIAAQWGLKH